MQLKFTRLASPGARAYIKRATRSALLDVLVVFIAYAVAISVWSFDFQHDMLESVWLILCIAAILVETSFIFGVYRRIWARTSGHGVVVIINAVVVATVIMTPLVLIGHQDPLPLPIILLGNLLALCGFTAVRYRSRLATSFVWRSQAALGQKYPHPVTRTLIIGAGESGQALAWRLMHRFHPGDYKIVGFIDDDPEKLNMYVEGCRILGARSDIGRIAEAYTIDLIVVAIHNISGADFRAILTACENTKALVKVVPDLQELVTARRSQPLLRDVQAEDLIGRKTISRHEAVDLTPLVRKVILVTGAAGSIGSELSRQIMQFNPTCVVLLDNNESGLHDLVTELRATNPAVDLIPALVDITNRSNLRLVYRKYQPQIVFHAAAYKHVPMLESYPHEALRVNVGGTRNVAELARDFNAERFVLISTDKAVNPSSIMGASKRACELMLQALAQDNDCHTYYASVRFGNVLGSRGSVVPTFNRQIDNGGPVTVTDQEMTRYFMSIPEAVNLILHAACLTEGNDIYVLRMGEVVRIVELAERMIRLRGLRPYKDIEIEFTGVRPGEKMHEELFYGEEQPEETLHPDIFKIDVGSEGFNAQEFWNQLEFASEDTLSYTEQTVNRLFRLIQSKAEPSLQEQEVQPKNKLA